MIQNVATSAHMNFKVDVVDFLTALGVRNVRLMGDEVAYSCPFPGHSAGDSNPSASMNADTTIFYCFGCQSKGNAVTFLSLFDGISPVKALHFLRDRYSGGFQEPVGSVLQEIEELLQAQQEETAPDTNGILDEEIQRSLEVDWRKVDEARAKGSAPEALTYLMDRGLTADSLAAAGVGFDSYTERLTIPVRDERGGLIGFKARTYVAGRMPKYLILRGCVGHRFEPYKAGLAVWGAHDAKPIDGTVIVTEGELNALKLRQVGYPNAVSHGSATFTREHARIISSLCSRVVLFFDSDDAGKRGMRSAAEKLVANVAVHVVEDREQDPMGMRDEDIKTLLTTTRSYTELIIGGQ